jgi:N-carbamoylputrescine amidase
MARTWITRWSRACRIRARSPRSRTAGLDLRTANNAHCSSVVDDTADHAGHLAPVAQGHAAANMLPVIAANRIGFERDRSCVPLLPWAVVHPGPWRDRHQRQRKKPSSPIPSTWSGSGASGPAAAHSRQPDLYTALVTLGGQSRSD